MLTALTNAILNATHSLGKARWELIERKGKATFWLPKNKAAKRRFGTARAYAVGTKVFFRNEKALNDAGLRAHELTHVRQFLRNGVLFEIHYAWCHCAYGYENNEYEKEARAAQKAANKKKR